MISCDQDKNLSDYKDPSLSIEERAADLLSKMTIEEKIAEMTSNGVIHDEQGYFDLDKNVEAYTYGFNNGFMSGYENEDFANYTNKIQKFNIEHTRLGIPALVGAEGLHGYMVKGTTVFPQAIALASTWDTALIEKVASAVALEMRATGAHRALGPVLDLARDPRWGRTEETFGEDPYLLSRIGLAFTNGLQGRGELFLDENHVISNLKHFAVHGQPEGGLSTGPGNFSERIIRENHLYPFEVVIKQGNAMGIMVTYNEIDGVPMVVNYKYMTSILKEEWGFKGSIGPDYGALDQLYTRHNVAKDSLDAIKQAIDAGLQRFGLRYRDNFSTVLELYNRKLITDAQIDSAVFTLLNQKFLLGLFENPLVDESLQAETLNSKAHRELALETARKSIILLKNEDDLLPLDAATINNLAVIGPNAGDIHLGAYTKEPRVGISVLEGMQKFAKGKFNIHYAEGCKI
ncbi:MAG: glycoside hydrolase family 3 protein, partial [Cyclobacteriaceae bacterium]|nr:glycoside hydrolase family 3 protein [Cyclobacteriaceae bacterium]